MNPPANWYPDPTGRHGQRYWDGSQWTEHVFTDGVQGVDPLESGASDDSDAGADSGADADAAGQDVDASATTAPAELPRRQRRAATSTGGQMDEPMEGAEGLFGADGDAEPAPVDETPEQSPITAWAPDEAGAPAADDVVATEVETEDVVANVEEATDGQPDFSDAFVLAPETASRLVGRSEPTPEPEPEAQADDAAEEAVDPSEPDDDVDTDAQPVADEDPTSTDVPVDAPPPAMPAPVAASSGGLGITGDLVGGAFAEREGGGAVALQNSRMLRCAANTGIVARQGTMVAYQGDVQFERQGAGGVGRALKRAATGEGLAMMRVTGNGDVFFADGGQHVFLLQLDGGAGLSVNGRNVLAFSASLQWDIERVKGASLLAGGLFNTTLTGTGWVALVADGEPVVLRTDEAPTFVDVNALVAWSGGLSTRIVNTVSAKSLVGLGSGEAFQMAFDGAGIVIVQPSEGPMGGPAAT